MKDISNAKSMTRTFLYDVAEVPDGMTLEQVMEEYQLTGLISVKRSDGEVVKIVPNFTEEDFQYDPE